jgi:phage shock protein PspC (stress-responsive transcriptional regulator)
MCIRDSLNTDPTVIRIIFVILAILGVGFGGLVLYLALWLIVPEEPLEVGMMASTPVQEPEVEEPAVE